MGLRLQAIHRPIHFDFVTRSNFQRMARGILSANLNGLKGA
jgi:hypothetical protein